MRSEKAGLRVLSRGDDGFTIIEALVAVTVLSIAIVLSIQPVMTALRGVSDARIITVSENLAQAEIEIVRSLSYGDIGLPGRTPEGTLTEDRTITVEGRDYRIELDIQYAGSVTGLNVIPQGGDGVEGSWDPGVDYKVVSVSVTGEGRDDDPIVMETIIAPTRVGEHESIANGKVLVAAHEPFQASGLDLPSMKIHAPPAAEIRSGLSASEQAFAAIPPATYTVLVDNPNGWVIHPDDLIAGLDQLVVSVGTTATTTLRVYRPATLELDVLDADTLAPIADARLTLTHLDSGTPTAYLPGEYTIANLIPDAFGILVTAPGYFDWTLASLNIPANYPTPLHELTVYMQPLPPPSTTTTTGGSTTSTTSGSTTTTTTGGSTTTTTTLPPGNPVSVSFTVLDNRNMVIAGATVTATHATYGNVTGTTDKFGTAVLTLYDGESYTVVGSTNWGHGPDSDPLTVGGPVDDLELSRPSGMGAMRLNGGDRAEFLYRSAGNWTVMPANFEDSASFMGFGGWYQVAKRCLADGEVEGTKWVRVRSGRNRSTTITGFCP